MGNPRPTGNLCTPGTDVDYEGKLLEDHCLSSSSPTFELDEWVRAEALVYGDSLIIHIINGTAVLQYTNPRVGGGVVNEYDPAVKRDGEPLSGGYIALQSEGTPI